MNKTEETETEELVDLDQELAAETEEVEVEATEPEELEEVETLETETEQEEEEPEPAQLLEEEPEKKGPPKSIPYDRFKRVNDEKKALKEKVADLEESIGVHEEFLSTLSDRYSRFSNPTAQMRADADLADAIESLVKSDPEVAKAIQKVTKFMESGVKEAPKAETEKAPTKDSRVEKILERDARRSTTTVLEQAGITKAMQSVIADYVVGRAEDLATLSDSEIVTLTKAFMKEKGFKLADIKAAAKAEEKAKAKDKPKTGKSQAAALSTKTTTQKEESKPKTREQFLQDRRATLTDIISQLSGKTE